MSQRGKYKENDERNAELVYVILNTWVDGLFISVSLVVITRLDKMQSTGPMNRDSIDSRNAEDKAQILDMQVV